MLFKVTGIYKGTSKAGNPFNVLHVVELERRFPGMTGEPVGTYYCTNEVAAMVEVGKTYDLSTEFGTKNVNAARLVEEK